MNNEGALNDCTLNDPEWKQCCCNCVFHLPTHEHCSTNRALRDEKDQCICGIRNGWSCCFPESGRVYTNWPEHSVGCECYQAKPPQQKEEEA